MGNITQSDEIDGYIVKENLKEKVTLKIDTGFTGYDVAIPSNIAQKLKAKSLRICQFLYS